MSISSYHREENNNELLQYAEEKRKEDLFIDVTIVAGTQSIPCNKLVLSCYSKFFEKLFQTNMKEKYQNTVEINGFDGRIIKMIVDYIYSGVIKIDTENVMSILAASDYLQLDTVKKFCFKYLMASESTTENCLNIMSAVILYKPDISLAKASQLICVNLEETSQTENFKAFSQIDLISIIEKLDKNEANEKAKYTAIINWVNSEPETRSKDFPVLFQLINVDKLPLEFLENVVANDRLVKDNPDCTNAVLACTLSIIKEMKSKETGSKILCVEGNKRGAVFELPILRSKSIKTYPKLPLEVDGHCVAKVQNYIYCIGGDNKGSRETERVFQLNLNDPVLKWTEVASLNKARSFFGCTVLYGTLVVAGGYKADNSVELYEEQSNKWKTISSLVWDRCENALVACDGCIYTVGGWEEQYVERLSEFDVEWERVQSLLRCRARLAAVNCGGFIYAIGGHDCEGFVDCSVEKYDPNANEWTYVAEMNIERSGHSACVVHDEIFVVGGTNQKHEFVREIECYNTTSDTWSIVGETDIDLRDHSLLVI